MDQPVGEDSRHALSNLLLEGSRGVVIPAARALYL
jgi:hypothetical protein